MLDTMAMRERIEPFIDGLARRGFDLPVSVWQSLTTQVRHLRHTTDTLNAEKNQISREFRQATPSQREQLVKRSKDIDEQLHGLKDAFVAAEGSLVDLELTFPNVPFDSVPDGKDESQNVVISTHGEPNTSLSTDHVDILEALGAQDSEAAAKMSGARFSVLKGPVAMLHRALGQMMIDLHTREHGYVECDVPWLVERQAAIGTGQLPKFEHDLFCTQDGTFLIPTAEISLTNIVAQRILTEDTLPLRLAALTPCFRREAGSYGKDTRGLIRQHQFLKVELVHVTTPETAAAEFDALLHHASRVLDVLEIPYRLVELCCGDIGFAAKRTVDLEVWCPGQQVYREISSCSHFGDFQARRMRTRYRPAESGVVPVCTLNGSGVAVGRALVAVLENYWDAERQELAIPSALVPYCGRHTVISAATT